MVPTARQPGEGIEIASVPNLRDLGGWPTPDGRVRSGAIFRSAEFSNLTGDDAAAFARLGIRSVYDMRTADERAASPNQVSEPEHRPAVFHTAAIEALRTSFTATAS